MHARAPQAVCAQKVSKVQVSKQTEYIYVCTYMYVCAYIDVCVFALYWEEKNDFNKNKKDSHFGRDKKNNN